MLKKWVIQHFQRYCERSPWDFCWRISLEGTIVSLLLAFLLAPFGVALRDISSTSGGELLFLGVIVAPLFETLIFQALPVWIARLYKAGFAVQLLSSIVPFFLAHVTEGLGTGLCAGLVGGFYFAFTYVHWRKISLWTAIWTTAVSHAIHNGLVILPYVAFSGG